MLQKDLIREVKFRLNTIKGQLDGIIKMLDQDKDPEQILLQFKAGKQALASTELLLLDETFRKSLAVKLAETMEACPGNCGQEDAIERLKKQFPDLALNELAKKMKEIEEIYKQMQKNREENKN